MSPLKKLGIITVPAVLFAITNRCTGTADALRYSYLMPSGIAPETRPLAVQAYHWAATLPIHF
jgi:hypothetical protein